MPKFLFVVGSTREKSFNRQLAKKCEEALADHTEVSYLDYFDVPFINQDEEWPTPRPVAHVRAEVEAADGIWIFCPEYNGSYPGIVKNLIDWLSRPTVEGDRDSVPSIAGKKVTVSGAGGGASTRNMQTKLFELLTSVKAEVLDEPTVGIRLDKDAWVSDVLTFDEDAQVQLDAQIEAFLQFVEK